MPHYLLRKDTEAHGNTILEVPGFSPAAQAAGANATVPAHFRYLRTFTLDN